VHAATAEARRLAIAESRPVLVEAMTYRVSHHSTSDDSTRYRSVDEIKEAVLLDPIERCFNYLQRNGWWSSEEDEELRKQERKNVLKALDVAERRDKPEVKHLFTDVYGGEQPEHLKRQEKELWAHFEKYPDAGGGH
jgi:2-oxoisovalerate dehydrogenase E1 component alpha subunit